MKTSLARFVIGAVLAVVAITAGYAKTGDEVLYCSSGDQDWRWWHRKGAMHIDLERALIYGGDTSSTVDPLVDGHFAGFEASFPLLLFSDSVDPTEVPESVVSEDIVFRFSPVERSPADLWLITAKPKEAGSKQAWRQRSTVLYSTADGVLLIGLSASIGDEIYAINVVPCGNRTLRYDDLRSFAEANG